MYGLRKYNYLKIWNQRVPKKSVWMSLFCWTQRKIFWRMWETEPFWAPLTSIVFISYYGNQWCPKTACLQTFFKISSFVFIRTNKFIQVWNYLRVSKRWQIFFFFAWTIHLRLVLWSGSQNGTYCVRDILTLFNWRCFQVGGRIGCCGWRRCCGSRRRIYWHCTSLRGRQARGAWSTSANAILSRWSRSVC